MYSIFLGAYDVHGETGTGLSISAYDSGVWGIRVYYDGADIWTEDEYGDIDVIGQADDLKAARKFVVDYFNHSYYEKLA